MDDSRISPEERCLFRRCTSFDSVSYFRSSDAISALFLKEAYGSFFKCLGLVHFTTSGLESLIDDTLRRLSLFRGQGVGGEC